MIASPAGRRALVTGASGFVGRQLVRHLRLAGWEVAALVRTTPRAPRTPDPRFVTYSYTGLTSEILEALATFRPSVVYHLASLFLSAHTSAQVEPLIAANILLGTQVLEAMQAAGVRVLVNAGSSWQNTHSSGAHPVNLYAATKQAFEAVLTYYVEYGGLSAVTLRLYDTYGPRDTRSKLIPCLLNSLRSGETLALSPGEQVMDLVHVEDVCRALLRAGELACEGAGAQVFAASGEQRRTVREVVATLEEAAGRKIPVAFGTRPYREGELMTPWEGEQLPGWTPKISLADGFRSLLVDEWLA